MSPSCILTWEHATIWHSQPRVCRLSHLRLPLRHLKFSPESISPSEGVQSASPWSVLLHCSSKVSPWFHLTFSYETTILPYILTWEDIPIRSCPVSQSVVCTFTMWWLSFSPIPPDILTWDYHSTWHSHLRVYPHRMVSSQPVHGRYHYTAVVKFLPHSIWHSHLGLPLYLTFSPGTTIPPDILTWDYHSPDILTWDYHSTWHSHMRLLIHLTFSPGTTIPSDILTWDYHSIWHSHLILPFHLTFSPGTTIPSDILTWDYHSIWHSHLGLPFHLTFSPGTTIPSDILTWDYHSIWHSHLILPFHMTFSPETTTLLTFSPETTTLPDILTWDYHSTWHSHLRLLIHLTFSPGSTIPSDILIWEFVTPESISPSEGVQSASPLSVPLHSGGIKFLPHSIWHSHLRLPLYLTFWSESLSHLTFSPESISPSEGVQSASPWSVPLHCGGKVSPRFQWPTKPLNCASFWQQIK